MKPNISLSPLFFICLLVLAILTWPYIGFAAWIRLGADIDGEEAGDMSGSSVSLSENGTVVAIGALYNNGGGTLGGNVRVYQNISGTWTQIGADIDGREYDYSGSSVSLSEKGTTIAIGAPGDAGHVRLYQNISGTWTQIGADIVGEAAGDGLGSSVSLSADGTVVAIGAPYNCGSDDFAGHVRIYRNISGTWIQVGADIEGEAAVDFSGSSVSLSADGMTVAIGAPGNDGISDSAGHVRVYRNISGTWTQIGTDIDGKAAFDFSGRSVSLSADGMIVAIGAPGNDGRGIDAGHVRVYRNISGTWTQIGADIDGEAAGDESGSSVSLSADGAIIAIGAPFNFAADYVKGTGYVRIFQNKSGTWTQISSDIEGSSGPGSVSLSSDGMILAIGEPYNSDSGTQAGHVVVFENKFYWPIFLPAITSHNENGVIQ
jgi:Flp pilus assembly pilin Flp